MLEADWEIDLIGLDVTSTIQFPPRVFLEGAEKSPIIGGFISNISEFYIKFYEGIVGKTVCLMHDPAAIMAITDPDIFTFQKVPLSVIMEGEKAGNVFVCKNSERRPVNVAINVDIESARSDLNPYFQKPT